MAPFKLASPCAWFFFVSLSSLFILTIPATDCIFKFATIGSLNLVCANFCELEL